MAQDIRTLKVTTPLFLYGADQREPEIRTASVRGQLRYWFRAIEGANTVDLKELWKAESALFGSTEGSSVVSLRLYADGELKTASYAMLPHRKETREQSWQDAISPDQKLRLEIVTRPGVARVPPKVIKALITWLLLGGLGKRSRRMFGALESSNLTGKLADGDALADTIGQNLQTIVKYSDLPGVPAFPTLHPDYSRVVVGTAGFPDWETLIRELFGLLRSDQYRSHERTFGYAMNGRRASPLIAQVRRIGDKYYPVLTAMRSTPARDINWQILDSFMDDAEARWNGKTVWGGKLAR
jgi:CRISPR-associated protein Cmr1